MNFSSIPPQPPEPDPIQTEPKERSCKCGSTEHNRISNKKCPLYKPKASNVVRANQKRLFDGEQVGQKQIRSVPSTVVSSMEKVLKVPELQSTINFVVEQQTRTMKILCEVMNVVLTRASLEDQMLVDEKCMLRIVHAISTTYREKGKLPDLLLPETLLIGDDLFVQKPRPSYNRLEFEVDSILFEFRDALTHFSYEPFRWPIRVTQTLQYAVSAYFVNLQKHATLHFKKRFKKFCKWISRIHIMGISAREQDLIWVHVLRRFEPKDSPLPEISESCMLSVDEIESMFKNWLPKVKNPITRSDQNQKHWASYLAANNIILNKIEMQLIALNLLGLDTQQPPAVFSLSPILGFTPQHIMMDETGVQQLCSLHRQITGKTMSEFPNRSFSDVFDTSIAKSKCGSRTPSGTLTTDGVQVSLHLLKRVKMQKESFFPEEYEKVHLNEHTIVLGMDTGKPGGDIAGGPVSEVGVKPTQSFSVSTKEYFHLTGMNDSRKNLESYLKTNGYSRLQNEITTAKTSDTNTAMIRLRSFARVAEVLFTAYANGPSRKDKWKVAVAKPRVLHRFARRIANLGKQDENGQDFDKVRLSSRARKKQRMQNGKKKRHRKGNRERKKKHAQKADIVFVVGSLNAPYIPGIKGNSMPLKALVHILKSYKYVRALVHLNEDRTSQECNKCYHAGNPALVNQVTMGRQGQWRLKQCERCHTFWHRDVVAALNIRSVWLYANSHQGERPENLKGFKGHASCPVSR